MDICYLESNSKQGKEREREREREGGREEGGRERGKHLGNALVIHSLGRTLDAVGSQLIFTLPKA